LKNLNTFDKLLNIQKNDTLKTLDWIVLIITVAFISFYGMWKNRRSQNIQEYLLANRSLKWYSVALSIIATQASAITFLSAPGQAYFEGMGFVQIYFGLPLAMIVTAYVFLPRFYQWNVVTAYEFIERKFAVKVRLLTAILFLLQRGLAAGIVISAPSIILTNVLGWNFYVTVLVMGGLVVLYTTIGGSAAVSQTQFQQMIIILGGMGIAAYCVVANLPEKVHLSNAIHFAANANKMNVLDWDFDMGKKYTVWSGLLGGFFLTLSYFGADQSQVERYLSGSSQQQSRIGLLFNALFKIPMQFFILMIGALLFVFFQFEKPPIFFNESEIQKIESSQYATDFQQINQKYDAVFEARKSAAAEMIAAEGNANAQATWQQKNEELNVLRKDAKELMEKNNKSIDSDQNYMFLHYVIHYLPSGLVGLLIAVIFFASMSTTAAELNALASVSLVDIYKRLIFKDKSDAHYVLYSRIFTVVWAIIAVCFAMFAHQQTTLIEAINLTGSLFYGTILGIFLMVFFSEKLSSNAVFYGALASQVFILMLHFRASLGIFPEIKIAYLWYNMFGCVGAIGLSYLFSLFFPYQAKNEHQAEN
jgi:SSS family transporter